MYKMTSKERFARAFQHKEADRVVMWDFPGPARCANGTRRVCPRT